MSRFRRVAQVRDGCQQRQRADHVRIVREDDERDAIVAAWLMLFVIFIRELGATILLYAQGTETISVALVVLSERSTGFVAALAVIQLLLLLIAFSLFRASRASLI